MSKQAPATVLLTVEQLAYLDDEARVVSERFGGHMSRSAVLRRLIDDARKRQATGG